MREGRELPCRTADIPLGMEASPEDLEPPEGVDAAPARGARRAARVPLRARARRVVLAIAAERPELAAPIVAGQPDLLAEAAVAARLEQARSVARRAAAPDAPRHPRRGRAATDAEAVCRSPGDGGSELGWDEDAASRGERGRVAGELAAEGANDRRRCPPESRILRDLDGFLPRQHPPGRPPRPRGRARRGALPHARPRGAGRGARAARIPADPVAAARRPARARRGHRRRAARARTSAARWAASTPRPRRLPRRTRRRTTPTEDVSGVLDLIPQRYGFLRLGASERPTTTSTSPPSQIRRCELRAGDEVAGPAREPRRGERYRALVHVERSTAPSPAASGSSSTS